MTFPPQGPPVPPQGPPQGPPPVPPLGPPPAPPPAARPSPPEQPTQRITRPPSPSPVTQPIPTTQPAAEPAPQPRRWWAGDPLSVVLVFVIVTAVVLAGLLGAELYARNKADSILAKAVSCVVKDNAKVSFGLRPFLLQHFSRTYSGLDVQTAGNQIRAAKGMKLDLRLDDVHLNPTAESAGTMGALDANVTWSSEGIRQTAQDIIPVLGDLVSDVSTEPSNGTIELRGGLGAVTIKPRADDG